MALELLHAVGGRKSIDPPLVHREERRIDWRADHNRAGVVLDRVPVGFTREPGAVRLADELILPSLVNSDDFRLAHLLLPGDKRDWVEPSDRENL